MTSSEEEQQPLLAASNQHEEAATFSKATWYSMIASSWNIYQLIFLYIIYQMCILGPYSSKIEVVRDLTCARYYEVNPDLIDYTDKHPCSADIVEKEAAWLLLATDMITGFASALSMLFFGKRFSTWGRRPILMISFLPTVLISAVCVAMPKGYPYGPAAADSLVTPTHCIVILLFSTIVGGLLGGETLTICCFRLLIVDNSTAANRTRNLVYLQLATQIGSLSGPLLYGAISYVFPVASSSIDNFLQVTYSSIIRVPEALMKSIGVFKLSNSTNTPLTPDVLTDHGNITPFLINIALGIFAITYIWVSIPETAERILKDGRNTDPLRETPSNAKISPLQALKPVRGSNGRLDWRIPTLLVSLFFFDGGAGCLVTYVLFFGHTFQWGSIKVDWLLSSFGMSRLTVILFLLPASVIFLEKRVKRPASLQHISVEQIKEIAKGSSAETSPAGESDLIAAEGEEVDIRVIQGCISLWRARVDQIVVKVSWIFDLIGWSTIALGAMLKHQGVMLLGGVIIALGTGGLPAFNSYGVAVTSDVLARSHDGDVSLPSTPGTHSHAAEVYFALGALLDSIFGTIMPPMQNLLYSSTLTIFPAAPFIAAVVYYGIAFIVLSTINIHRP